MPFICDSAELMNNDFRIFVFFFLFFCLKWAIAELFDTEKAMSRRTTFTAALIWELIDKLRGIHLPSARNIDERNGSLSLPFRWRLWRFGGEGAKQEWFRIFNERQCRWTSCFRSASFLNLPPGTTSKKGEWWRSGEESCDLWISNCSDNFYDGACFPN